MVSDGSACVMATGEAARVKFDSLTDFAALIDGLNSVQAISLGRLDEALPDQVTVVTKRNLDTRPAQIARTALFINYAEGKPALLLLDHDAKGMPRELRERLTQMGGFTPALCDVAPAIKDGVGLVYRLSTSAGISRTDTGEAFPGSDGRHLYVLVESGVDNERALRALHDRLWLSRFGWMNVGGAGQLLERSIVDRMVFAPGCRRSGFALPLRRVADRRSHRLQRQAQTAGARRDRVLPERPCYYVTAGQRGNGKTPAVNMIGAATLGQQVSAAAWSYSKDERRKALLAYLGEGVPLIAWDNIDGGLDDLFKVGNLETSQPLKGNARCNSSSRHRDRNELAKYTVPPLGTASRFPKFPGFGLPRLPRTACRAAWARASRSDPLPASTRMTMRWLSIAAGCRRTTSDTRSPAA
jgi:hypothetical protein